MSISLQRHIMDFHQHTLLSDFDDPGIVTEEHVLPPPSLHDDYAESAAPSSVQSLESSSHPSASSTASRSLLDSEPLPSLSFIRNPPQPPVLIYCVYRNKGESLWLQYCDEEKKTKMCECARERWKGGFGEWTLWVLEWKEQEEREFSVWFRETKADPYVHEKQSRTLPTPFPSPNIYLFHLHLPPNRPLSPALEFLSLSLHILFSLDFQAWLSLLSQRFALNPSDTQLKFTHKDDLPQAGKLLDVYLSDLTPDQCQTLGILVSLGYMDVQDLPPLQNLQSLLSLTISHLPTLLNHGNDRCRALAAVGISILLIWGLKNHLDAWKTLGKSSTDPDFPYQNLIKQAIFSHPEFRQSGTSFHFLEIDLISASELPEFIQECQDLDALMLFFRHGDVKSVGKAELKAVINTCLRPVPSQFQLKALVAVLLDKPELHDLLICSDFPEHLQKWLMNSEYFTCFVPLLAQTEFRKWYPNIDIYRIVEKLMIDGKSRPKVIAEKVLVPLGYPVKEVFMKWVEIVIGWNKAAGLGVAEVIGKISSEYESLQSLLAPDNLAHQVITRLDREGEWVLSWAPAVSELTSSDLRSEFLTLCRFKFVQYDKKSRIYQKSLYSALLKTLQMLDKAVSEKKSHAETMFLMLINAILELSEIVTESDVFSRLLSNPNYEVCWEYLLKYIHLLPTSPYLTALKRHADSLANLIVSMKIKFEMMDKIDKMNGENRKKLYEMLKIGENEEEKVHEKYADCYLALQALRDYLAFLYRTELNPKVLRVALQKFEEELPWVPLAAFRLPSDLQAYYDSSLEFRFLFPSSAFLYCIEREKSSPSLLHLFSLRHSTDLCLTAKTHLVTSLTSILSSLDTTSVSDLLPFFSITTDVKTEIDVLRTALPTLNGLAEVGECLETYRRADYWKSVFQGLKCVSSAGLLCPFDSNFDDFSFKRSSSPTISSYLSSTRLYFSLLSPFPASPRPLFDLLAAISSQSDMVLFLAKVSERDIEFLYSVALDLHYMYLNTVIINEIRLFSTFLSSIKSANLQEFLINADRNVSKEIVEAGINLIPAYREVKKALERSEEGKNRQFKEEMMRGVRVRVSEEGEIDVVLDMEKERVVSYGELEELKDRDDLYSQLRSTPPHSSLFSSLFSSIQLLQKTLETGKSLGKLIQPFSLSAEAGNWEVVEQCCRESVEVLNDWERTLHSLYLARPMLAFFHSSQFWTLEKYLCCLPCASHTLSLHLLEYAGLAHLSPLRNAGIDTLSLTNRLDHLSDLLTRSPAYLPHKPVLNFTPSPDHRLPCNRIIHLATTESLLEALISVYANGPGQLPCAWQVLWCRKETVWGEVMAFVYRYWSWKEENVLFALVECEELEAELQTKARGLMDRLMRREERQRRCGLAVITKQPQCILFTYFKTLDSSQVYPLLPTRLIQDPSVYSSILTQTEPSTLLVSSDFPGNGKTFWITQHARSMEKDLLTIHLTGDIDMRDLCIYLQTHLSPSKSIHIRLGPLLSHAQIDYVLSSFVLFRVIKSGEYLASIGFSHIYIETDGDYSTPFIRLLPSKTVNFSLFDLQVTSEIQLISRYLHVADRLDEVNIDSIQVDNSQIRSILSVFFVNRQQIRGQPVTFRNLITFSRVIFALLTNLEKGIFTTDSLNRIIDDLIQIKMNKLAKECEEMRVNVLKGVLMTVEEVNTMTLSRIHDIRDNKRYRHTVVYEDRNHFLTVFTEDGTFIPVYRDVKAVPRFIGELIYLQRGIETGRKGWLPELMTRMRMKREIETGEIEIMDYGKMTSTELTSRLHHLFSTFPSPSPSTYIMTSDNFVKMMLIYLRAISHIPILIMGETGCGKTYLIQYFVENILKEKLKIVSIHAGYTQKMHIRLMEEVVKEAGKVDRLWVFLDEFNTSNAVGVIAEMMCERQVAGIRVPENVVLLAACNPYRLKPPAYTSDDIGLTLPHQLPHSSDLVHRVTPLPTSLIDFIWDFGTLTPTVTYQYISTIVHTMHLPDRLHPVCVELIFAAHMYFQGIDGSLVSLRDVGRVRKMVEWFSGSVRLRKDMMDERFKAFFDLHKFPLPWGTDLELADISLLLAFSTCYLLRISSHSQRDSLLSACLAKVDWLTYDTAVSVIRGNENDILGRMEIPPGIALNEAVRENLCTLFQCVFAGIPVILCGKPGCSKSLSVQILCSSCVGYRSADPYIRLLPRLHPVPFQGSETCTSLGIETVFHTAHRLKSDYLDEEVLPVVLLEEIGAAELSPHNPLKVLHSLLQSENMQIAFIGLSNWKLDASKMNRVVYLARPVPELEDLVTTADSLVVGGRLDNREIVQELAKTYVAFQKKMEETVHPNFFGLRDFYHLVRQVTHSSSLLPISDSAGLYASIFTSIYRNFNGTFPGPELFLTLFHQVSFLKVTPLPVISPLDLVVLNLNDYDSRNLVLISSGESGLFILETTLKSAFHRYKVFIGSQLNSDIDSQDYAKSILKQVILCMEQGIPIILSSLKGVYSGLYDLFNQNYIIEAGRRYCQVALGECHCPRRMVHREFKAVVVVRESEVDAMDMAFLNRFEKQKVTLEDVLTPSELSTFHYLQNYLTRLFRHSQIPIHSVIPFYSPEFLQSIIHFKSTQTNSLREIIKISTEDMLILAENGGLDGDEREFLLETWVATHDLTVWERIMQEMERKGEDGVRNMCVFVGEGVDIRGNREFDEREVWQRHISAFKSEKSLVEDVGTFLKGEAKVYVLGVSLGRSGKHVMWVKYVLEKMQKEYVGRERKVVCLVIYTSRSSLSPPQSLTWLHSWPVSSHPSCPFPSLLSLDSKALLLQSSPRFPLLFPTLLQSSYAKLRFKGSPPSHIKSFLHLASLDSALTQTFHNKVLTLLQTSTWCLPDWKQAICTHSDILRDARNTKSAVDLFIEKELIRAVLSVVVALEKQQAVDSYCALTEADSYLKEIWLDRFSRLRVPEIYLSTGLITLDISPIQLEFPFSMSDILLLSSEMTRVSTSSLAIQLNEYRKLTQFREEMGEMEGKEGYMRDFVRWERGEDMIEEAMELHRMLAQGAQAIDVRIVCYFHYKSLVHTILQVFSCLRSLNSTGFACLPRLQSLHSLLLPQLPLDTPPDPLSLPVCYLKSLSDYLDFLCIPCKPSANLQSLGLFSYSRTLNFLFSLLKTLKNQHNFPLQGIIEVEFWTILSQFAFSRNLTWESLIDLNRIAENAPKNTNFMLFPPFRNATFELISKKSDLNTKNSFKMTYFRLILLTNSDILVEIAKEIDENADFYCNTRLLKAIVGLSGLNEPEILRNEIQNDEIDEFSRGYLEKLDGIIRENGVKSRFFIVLSDFVVKEIEKSRGNVWEKEYVREYFEEFERSYQDFLSFTGEFEAIFKLISVSLMTVYMKNYADLILIDAKNEDLAHFDALISSNNPINSTFRLYLLKLIRKKANFKYEELVNWVKSDQNRSWSVGIEENCPFFAPLGRKNSLLYQETHKKLGKMINGNLEVDLGPEISSMQDPGTRLDVLTAIFTRFTQEKPAIFDSSFLQRFTPLFQSHLSSVAFSYLSFLRTGFEGSFLHLFPASSDFDRVRNRLVGLILTIIVSYSDVEGPLTTPFFTKFGGVYPNIGQNLGLYYLCGSESSPLYSHLVHLLSNFEVLKSDTWKVWGQKGVKGSAYRCSDDCDYVYFVESCGAPMRKDGCPYCKAEIGGVEHRPVKRPGHVNLSDDEARRFLRAAIDHYTANEPAGYVHHPQNRAYLMTVRPVSTVSYHILHLVQVVTVYLLYVTGMVREEVVREWIPEEDLERYFRETVDRDLAAVEVPISREKVGMWVESVISSLPSILSFSPLPTTLSARLSFEQAFDSGFIQPRLLHPDLAISTYYSQSLLSPSSTFTLIQEIHLDSVKYPYSELFRLREDGQWSRMKTEFSVRKMGEVCPLLDIYLTHHSSFHRLQCLYPLIRLTTYLHSKLSHSLTREDARSTSITTHLLNDPTGLNYLHQFLPLWNQIPPFPLQYMCKPIDFMRFGSDSELCYFLLDNKELAGGMVLLSAVLGLVKEQNQVLEMCWERGKWAEGNRDLVQVQTAREEVMVGKDWDEEVMDWGNRVEYGRGEEVMYDYQEMEQKLRDKLQKLVFLTADPLPLMQYQLEVQNLDSSESSLIADLREVLPQKPLTNEIAQEVENAIVELKEQWEVEFPKEIRRLYSSLEYLLIHVKTFPTDLSLSSLCSHLDPAKVHSSLLALGHIPLHYIVAIYEEVEKSHFQYIKPFIRPDFTQETDSKSIQKVVRKVAEWSEQDENVSLPVLCRVLLRFISRCLTGEANPSLSVSLYISRSDFWPEDVSDLEKDQFSELISGVKLANCVQLLEMMESEVKTRVETGRLGWE